MILDLELEIFILIAIGYYLGKKNLLNKQTVSQLTDFVIRVVLPCSIVSSFEMELTYQIMMSTMQVLLLSLGIQVVYWIFNHCLYNRWPHDEKINAQYGTMVSNASFVGMPIAQSLYGVTGLLYSSIYVLPQRIFMWSYGLSLYTDQKDKHLMKKILAHPCVISIFIGIVVMICYSKGVYLPSGISQTLKAIGGCSTVLCFVIIGTIVSELNIKELVSKHSLLFSLYRLLIIPLIMFVIVYFLSIDTLSKKVCVLLTTMPAATTTVIFANQYERNSHFASQLVIMSTLLSLVSIPFFSMILELI